ncbi:Exopolygalacturonase A [Colletotrichum sp. SAR 10_70]|nr:Exopolygalacturonase A [Colletotrichum sp. SAR 10_71]KAI8189460.1 Exopolygalacturonase A [Colletotrichum sp. SAR 10_75]KAI8197776.1 Exopolygalacturonase A [Colletotrichum sp. SAR 10_70]KAI8215473.1 Exopolygalacturonase A [Colletotrichum sp. SAR 10_76]KAI8231342.1 Exopolygalacturonase A [Colletotrichum sp. SAR 10_86]KAJ5006779.1 Exopolygalacturonase A [Colletotrichum sp. SAR 10_66]
MHFSNLALICVAAIASVSGYDVPPRPSIVPFPKAPGRALPVSPARVPSKVCIVCPKSGGDSAAAILKAAHDCNNGGTVVFMPNATYIISSRVDLTFLKHIDFAILGTIVFKDDVKYWQTNTFAYRYQNVNLMWRFGGEDVNIYGLGQGTIDGLGQTWWNALAGNSTVVRPLLLGTDGLKGGSITGLKMVNSPNWFNLIANSSDILISDMDLSVVVTNNTDGWDTYRSDNIVIQNSVIDNTDDCVSFKPNSTEVLVQGLVCNGSHGISVGSLGQYQGQVDIIEDLYIYNISMSNASDGARIKIWPGVPPNTTGSEAGGGLGHATLVIEDILFKDFTGTTSKKNDPRTRSDDVKVCKNIQAHNINVSPPSGKDPKWTCTNMDNSLLDIDCI